MGEITDELKSDYFAAKQALGESLRTLKRNGDDLNLSHYELGSKAEGMSGVEIPKETREQLRAGEAMYRSNYVAKTYEDFSQGTKGFQGYKEIFDGVIAKQEERLGEAKAFDKALEEAFACKNENISDCQHVEENGAPGSTRSEQPSQEAGRNAFRSAATNPDQALPQPIGANAFLERQNSHHAPRSCQSWTRLWAP